MCSEALILNSVNLWRVPVLSDTSLGNTVCLLDVCTGRAKVMALNIHAAQSNVKSYHT